MTVALVQAATTLPMFLFSLPAGALADIVDRRRLLIVVQIAAAAVAALFAILVWLDWVTPSWLLTFISLSGIATVLAMPSWQAILPQLVPKEGLRSAVALNGTGLNISRAIGPALAGLAIGALGMAAPYWVRGREMAMFATAQFAGLAVGSIVWGQAAQMIGFPAVHIIAAIALLASVPYCGAGSYRPPPVSISRRRCIGPLRCSHTTARPRSGAGDHQIRRRRG